MPFQFPGSGGGGLNMTNVVLDVGSIPQDGITFTVVDARVTVDSKIAGTFNVDPATKDNDENEMIAITTSFKSFNGFFEVFVKNIEGYLHDKYVLQYIVG